ncbi:hypothetical protein HYX08_05300 [Candidatus Woesearchaeota archaeon]|nr:hypothetical protein [Candidatus Woesearchaeota archaeon]
MPHIKRGWHNPSKYIEQNVEGKCPYCSKRVKSLKNHIKGKHKLEKPGKKK